MSKFLILTGDENSQSNQRIKAEIQNLGHEAEIRNPMHFVPFISDANGHDRLYFRDVESEKSERLIAKDYAGVVTRIGGSVFLYGMYILRQFENLGIFVSCPAFAAENCTDKFRTSQLLSRAKVPVPRQNLSWHSKNPGELIEMVDKTFPVWIKQIRGSKGVGVFQLTEPVSANQIMESFNSIPLIIQRDINKNKVGKRSDIRALVVGPETVNPQIVAYERISENKDTRSNFSIHKSGRPITLNDIERQDAIRAAKAVGAGISGVDIIRDEQPGSPTQGKSFVIEVNQNLGLSGIEEVTKVNCARIIAKYIVAESSRRHPNKPFWDMASVTALVEILSPGAATPAPKKISPSLATPVPPVNSPSSFMENVNRVGKEFL
ncbi:MAG TPA: RimK family alpha-L-glutamate ligase [Bacteroidales bacterium]|nr:RimK family alpha-L-glutamate ligase [Bacteroidales bacterium]